MGIVTRKHSCTSVADKEARRNIRLLSAGSDRLKSSQFGIVENECGKYVPVVMVAKQVTTSLEAPDASNKNSKWIYQKPKV